MTEPNEKIRAILDAGLDLLAEKYDTDNARRMLVAIAMQESNFWHRRQIKGPARGLWQFELTGGVWGVMNFRTTSNAAREVCELTDTEFESKAVYRALEHSDALACAFARLLLWTDPKPLPDSEEQAWLYYSRIWRPGKPHPGRWGSCWNRAIEIYP